MRPRAAPTLRAARVRPLLVVVVAAALPAACAPEREPVSVEGRPSSPSSSSSSARTASSAGPAPPAPHASTSPPAASSQPSAASSGAPDDVPLAPPSGSTRPLPKEPWFADKPEKTEDCVPPLASAPAPHFPPPFERCDTREIAWHTPPPGPHLHFHYRLFSPALTTAARKGSAGVCCYMSYKFPR